MHTRKLGRDVGLAESGFRPTFMVGAETLPKHARIPVKLHWHSVLFAGF